MIIAVVTKRYRIQKPHPSLEGDEFAGLLHDEKLDVQQNVFEVILYK